MRYGIIGDIHGNLEALETAVEACREEGVRAFFCIGDIVGYGANPKECIETVLKLKTVCVAGNHDWAVSGKVDTVAFNESARQAVQWTQNELSEKEKDFLKDLDLVFENEDFTLVHGTLNRPQSFVYLLDSSDAPDSFYLMSRSVCFVGHTHIPQILIQHEDKIQIAQSSRVELEEGSKYIINVGSIGQPRDGNPMAAYCIYDPDLQRIEIKRIAYDVKKAQEKIIQAGLPEVLAHRLAIGQ